MDERLYHILLSTANDLELWFRKCNYGESFGLEFKTINDYIRVCMWANMLHGRKLQGNVDLIDAISDLTVKVHTDHVHVS